MPAAEVEKLLDPLNAALAWMRDFALDDVAIWRRGAPVERTIGETIKADVSVGVGPHSPRRGQDATIDQPFREHLTGLIRTHLNRDAG